MVGGGGAMVLPSSLNNTVWYNNSDTHHSQMTHHKWLINRPSVGGYIPFGCRVVLLSVYSLYAAFLTTSWLQGRCKSCYAFAVTGALEGMKALADKKNELISLSEQNIIDCSGEQSLWKLNNKVVTCTLVCNCNSRYTVPYGNRGCGGGSRESSIMYTVDFGVDTSASYPYIARVCLHCALVVLEI